MKQILPYVYHWMTFHEGIQDTVHSYYIIHNKVAFLIDPRIPKQGLSWFDKHVKPSHIYLTNRLHYRHSRDFIKAFDCNLWCHEAGLYHFRKNQKVQGFQDKQRLPGNVTAINIDVLCPEETVLFIPVEDGVLSIADSIIHVRGKLTFVPDELLGDDPETIKLEIKNQFKKLLRRKFKHLLFAHGKPIIDNGKEILTEFVK